MTDDMKPLTAEEIESAEIYALSLGDTDLATPSRNHYLRLLSMARQSLDGGVPAGWRVSFDGLTGTVVRVGFDPEWGAFMNVHYDDNPNTASWTKLYRHDFSRLTMLSAAPPVPVNGEEIAAKEYWNAQKRALASASVGREELTELVRAAERYVECSADPRLTPYISENGRYGTKSPWQELRAAVAPAKAALSTPAPHEGEPVAWRYHAHGEHGWSYAAAQFHNDAYVIQPLYPSPPTAGQGELIEAASPFAKEAIRLLELNPEGDDRTVVRPTVTLGECRALHTAITAAKAGGA